MLKLLAPLLAPLLIPCCATWASTGSVYRDRCTHLGVRPAADGAGGYAVTVQFSTDWPTCPRRASPAQGAGVPWISMERSPLRVTSPAPSPS